MNLASCRNLNISTDSADDPFFLVIVSILISSMAQADYVLKYTMDEETQTYMYHSDIKSKFITVSQDGKSEIYRIGDKIYLVSYEDGEKTVLDMDEMKKMTQGLVTNKQEFSQKNKISNYTVKKTGKRVKVGGIDGEVAIVSGEDDGEKFVEEVVLTKDKRVVKTVHAMFDTFSSMGDMDIDKNLLEPQKGYVVIKADEILLESFREERISSQEYQLPNDAHQQKMPDFSQMKTDTFDACYEQVCCGKTAGESEVLRSALKNRFDGYELVGSGICDPLGLSSLMNIKSVEGALYKKGQDSIQITLNLDDKDGGILRRTKKNLVSGSSVGLVEDIKKYSEKTDNGIKVISGILVPMNQETFEYIINAQTTMTITKIRKTNKEPSLAKVVASGGVNLNKIKAGVASQQASQPKNEHKQEKKPVDAGVDEAVNMLKGLFK